MDLLVTLRDSDFSLPLVKVDKWENRICARAVLIKKVKNSYEIALINVTKENFYSLPGGGIDGNETIHAGLIREVLEETGCDAQIICEIGIIEEFMSDIKRHQVNHYFICKAVNIGTPIYTDFEKSRGFKIEWVNIDKGIIIMKNSIADNYLKNFYQAVKKLNGVSLRLSNVYGPRQDPQGEAGVIAIFINKQLPER